MTNRAFQGIVFSSAELPFLNALYLPSNPSGIHCIFFSKQDQEYFTLVLDSDIIPLFIDKVFRGSPPLNSQEDITSRSVDFLISGEDIPRVINGMIVQGLIPVDFLNRIQESAHSAFLDYFMKYNLWQIPFRI